MSDPMVLIGLGLVQGQISSIRGRLAFARRRKDRIELMEDLAEVENMLASVAARLESGPDQDVT